MELGEKIRKRRKDLGMSLRELARRVELTASFLSQVERGAASPSIDSLRAISRALEVPVFHFLLNPDDHNPVIRYGERRKLVLPERNIVYEYLTPVNRKVEVVLTEVSPEDGDVSPVHQQDTEECLYVVEGELEVVLGEESYVLAAGDTIYFEGPMLRRLRAVGEETARYLAIVTPPAF